ncbi:MAG TPA: hypothetical protein DCQ31_14125 [Bacteroidales bacterium]|nr:hypothetical protein [Bacteroidales bacterium]
MSKQFSGLFILLIITTLTGCRIKYSFTGASIDPNSKTFSVKEFPNNARLINPALSQSFSEALKDALLSKTSLALVNGDADLNFEGNITGYTIVTQAIKGDETAAYNRFTIQIKVKFKNKQKKEYDFENVFSAYRDFPANSEFTSIEDALMADIIKDLTQDIFQKSVVNW